MFLRPQSMIGALRRSCFALFAWALSLGGLQAQAPVLEIIKAVTGGVRLRARTSGSGEVTLESSSDLLHWQKVEALSPKAGAAEFAVDFATLTGQRFFRAWQTRSTVSFRVVPQLDTNQVAGALLTPEAGGTMQLTQPDGTRFEFLASSNLVRRPTFVKMTLITNFTDFPAHQGLRAAVAFEPDGLQFLGSATLRIQFPQAIAQAEMLGWSFDGDGSGFHLIASAVRENTVELELTHFSGKGVAKFAQAPPMSFNTAWDASRAAIKQAQDAHARRVREIRIAQYATEPPISEAEAALREKLSEEEKLEEIYREAIRPYEAQAAEDCAIATAVVTMELEVLARREEQLAGGTAEPNLYRQKLVALSAARRCSCARTLLERCETQANAPGKNLAAALEELLEDSTRVTSRTDAQGCELGDDDAIRQRFYRAACVSTWEGEVSIYEYHRTKDVIPNAAFRTTTSWDSERLEVYEGRVSGVVKDQTLEPIDEGDPLIRLVTLKTEGTVDYTLREEKTLVQDEVTRTKTSRWHATAARSTLATGEIIFRLVNGQLESAAADGDASDIRFAYLDHLDETWTCPQATPQDPCPVPFHQQTQAYWSVYVEDSVGDGVAGTKSLSTPTSITASRRYAYDVGGVLGFEPPDHVTRAIVLKLYIKPNP